jgi:hypothetical protein
MARRLFVVEDTYTILGRGLCLIPGIDPIENKLFRVGDPLIIKRADGSEIRTTIAAFVRPMPNPLGQLDLLVTELTKSDVPIGAEVWSIDQYSDTSAKADG